jgi:hypothetical protein
VATRSNKITIRVSPRRHSQVLTLRASGQVGKVLVAIPPNQSGALALSPATDPKTYWNAVLVLAQAQILSL